MNLPPTEKYWNHGCTARWRLVYKCSRVFPIRHECIRGDIFHHWSKADADVFCRQLGFKEEAAQPYRDATHGEGSGPIWLDHLVCSGNFPPMFLDLAIYCSSFYYTEILNLGIIPAGGIVYGDVFRSVCSPMAISLEMCVFRQI